MSIPAIRLPDMDALRQRERHADGTHLLLHIDGHITVYEPAGQEPGAESQEAAYRWYVGRMSGAGLADWLEDALPLLEDALEASQKGGDSRLAAHDAVCESLYCKPVSRFRPASPSPPTIPVAPAVPDDLDLRFRLVESGSAVRNWTPEQGVGCLWLLACGLKRLQPEYDLPALFSRAKLPGHGSAFGPAGDAVLAVDSRGDRLLNGLDGRIRVERAKPRQRPKETA